MTSGHFVQKCRAAGILPPPAFRLSGGGEPTATTRLITHHISKGETVAQSLKDRFDYGQNPEKTQDGELISAYECDHRTADAEFLLAKAKYKAVTGREQRRDADVLCYQIRQSFRPGEITPEEANRVGYETAMRWTKGKHAFFVATHTDRQHIHNHIYYNSTTLDYTGKFRDFFRSAAALRRLSDRVCLEHDLSVIQNPKLHSKGRFLHYGQWIGERPPSAKQRVRLAIVEALGKRPADFAAFLRLMEESGFAVKHGRGGVISFLAPGQEKPTRLRSSTLGPGFDPEDIRAVIAGERPIPELPQEGPPPPRRVDLIIDIQNRLAQGKGPAYERWAKVYNLKQMAAALLYLVVQITRPQRRGQRVHTHEYDVHGVVLLVFICPAAPPKFMPNLCGIVAIHRHRRIIERCQQVLLDVPNLGAVFFQALQYVLDMRGIQLHKAAFHHFFRLFFPTNTQKLLSAGDSFHQQFQNLMQNSLICRIALFQNFQFQSFLEIAAVLFFFLQFSRIDKIRLTIICLIIFLSITSV